MASSTLSSNSPVRKFLTSRIPPAFARLVWKEYRTLRAMWIILAGFAVIWQLFTPLLSNIDLAQAGFFGLPIMFALGAPVLLFASEVEERTATLLRIFPLRRGPVFVAKAGVGLFGLGLLALAVGIISLIWHHPSNWNAGFLGNYIPPWLQYWTQWQYCALVLYLWGICFVLLTGQALAALVLAPIAMVITVSLPIGIACPLLVVVTVADWWLTGRWLNDRPVSWPEFLSRRRARSVPRWFLFVSDSASPWKVSFARLMWLEWQNARPFLGLVLAAGVPVIVVGSWRWFELAFGGFSFPLAYLALLPVLMGAWSFSGEQYQRRYRLAAQRGVAAQTLWLSKHAVWLPCTVTVCGLLLWLDHLLHGLSRSWGFGVFLFEQSLWDFIQLHAFKPSWERDSLSRACAGMSLWLCLGYTCGQFTSVFFPRTITALVISLPLLFLSCMWWMFLPYFEIPVLWTVGPIPVVLLAATFVRSSDWLLERSGWWRWAKIGAVLAVPALPVFVGIMVYRVTQIPAPMKGRITTSGSDREQYLLALDRWASRQFGVMDCSMSPRWTNQISVSGTSKVYRPSDKRFVAQMDRAPAPISPIPEVSRVERQNVDRWIIKGIHLQQTTGTAFFREVEQRHKDALMQGTQLTGEGKLDEALEKYLTCFLIDGCYERHTDPWRGRTVLGSLTWSALQAWITHPKQTPGRIRQAICALEEEFSHYPSLEIRLFDHYARQREDFDADWSISAAEMRAQYVGKRDENEGELFLWTRWLFPWEKWRTRRLIDFTAAAEIHQASMLNRGLLGAHNDLGAWLKGLRRDTLNGAAPEPWNWWRTAPMPLPHKYAIPDYAIHLFQMEYAIYEERNRRGWLIVCALIAHRLEHGAFPEHLRELVPGSFTTLPTDPCTGHEFAYEPKGLPHPVWWGTEKSLWEANRPILWSPGLSGGMLILDTNPTTALQEPSPHFILTDRFMGSVRNGNSPMIFPIP